MLVEDGIDEQRAWMMKTVVAEFGDKSWINDTRDKDYIARLTVRIQADNRDPGNYGLPPKAR